MCSPYILSSYELAVLLAGLGADGLYGLNMDLEACSRARSVHTIHDLFSRALLIPLQKGFSIEPELGQCLRDCISAQQVIRILPQGYTPLCCYPGWAGTVVLIEPDNARSAGWLLRRVKACELSALLRDKEYLPAGFDAEAQQVRERLPHYWEEKDKDLSNGGETLLQIEWAAIDSTPVKDILITRGALDYDIVFAGKHMPYSEERLTKIILSWLNGSEKMKESGVGP